MMMSFGLINPTMFMMLAQNEKDSFDDNLKDYLVDQMSNGKKQFSSFDFYNQQKPMEPIFSSRFLCSGVQKMIIRDFPNTKTSLIVVKYQASACSDIFILIKCNFRFI